MTDCRTLPVDALRTALHCPRRYEFAHEFDLEGTDDDDPTADRVALLRSAICSALERGDRDREDLEATAKRRLSTLWADHDERFHSMEQRRHERRVLEATLEAYVEHVGLEHARGIDRLEADCDGDGPPLVGPDIGLKSHLGPADGSDEPPVVLEASVDYVYADGPSLVGVRFVPTLWPLGYLRYRSDWERVEDQFTDHFDPETDAFDPDPVATLLETAVVLDGLRDYRDRLGLSDRTCRYLQVPLADRSETSVNWVRGSVETSIEVADLTDVYIDHHTFARTHDHRNRTVDRRLESVVDRLRSDALEPTDRFEDVLEEICPDCEYRVCCGQYLGTEVGFDA